MFAFCETLSVSDAQSHARNMMLTLMTVYYSTQIDEMPMNVADLIA